MQLLVVKKAEALEAGNFVLVACEGAGDTFEQAGLATEIALVEDLRDHVESQLRVSEVQIDDRLLALRYVWANRLRARDSGSLVACMVTTSPAASSK